MQISDLELKAFLTCPTKGYMKSVGASPTEADFSEHQKRIENDFARQFRIVAERHFATEDCPPNISLIDAFHHSNALVLVNCHITTSSIKTTIHGVERITTRNRIDQYIPLRQISGEQIKNIDRILLAFDALAIESQTGRMPKIGRFIVGCSSEHLQKVQLTDGIVGSARSALDELCGFESGHPPPELILNRHCSDCEFQTRCKNLLRRAMT